MKNEQPNGVHLSPSLSTSDVLKALESIAISLNAIASVLGAKGVFVQNQITPQIAPQPNGSLTPNVRDSINEMLVAKARGARSDRYLRQLRVSLSSFAQGRANTPIDQVSLGDVEKWIFANKWTPRTQKNYLSDVRCLFRFALRRGWIQRDVASGVELPPDIAKLSPPGIHTPNEVKAVLEHARTANLDVMRHLAIRYFAGLRSAEIHRLTEQNISLERGFIEVPAEKAKTRRRRLVKIMPNLALWLAAGGVLRPMSPMTVRAVLKGCNVKWTHNVTRHSFVSYHLAFYENAAKTALQAGHTEAMTFSNYRELVTPEASKEYWSIVP